MIVSCSQNDVNNKNSNEIIAYVDTIPITIAQVDKPIKQELFDELNRIYFIRKLSLQELINEKLMLLEAIKYNTTVEALKDSIIKAQIKENKLQKYISDYQYDQGIMVLERSFMSYDIESPKGSAVLMERFEKYVIQNYIDSITKIYAININLEPPRGPAINFASSLIHYRGNLNSNVTVTVISDFECGMCREFHHIFDSLYSKYKNKVRFGFTNYGSYATISAIASESAAKQNKFWEMHDSLYNLKKLPDTDDIFEIAKNLKLDIDVFKKDFESEDIKNSIEQNLQLIINSGIYATPTVMVNNRPVFNSSSFNEIENMILNSLSNTNRR